jgi:hypothetical protein
MDNSAQQYASNLPISSRSNRGVPPQFNNTSGAKKNSKINLGGNKIPTPKNNYPV